MIAASPKVFIAPPHFYSTPPIFDLRSFVVVLLNFPRKNVMYGRKSLIYKNNIYYVIYSDTVMKSS